MAKETTATIAQWQRETFGHQTPEGCISRANKEMSELLEKICRKRLHTQSQADYSLDILIEAADVIITLCDLPSTLGHTSPIWKIVEHKMVINRERKWNVDSRGRGQHVPEPGE